MSQVLEQDAESVVQVQPFNAENIEHWKRQAVDACRAADNQVLRALEAAWRAGEALSEVKRRLAHGAWLPWLREAGIAERTARRYRTLFEGYPEIGLLGRFGGIHEAVKAIPPKRAPKPALPAPKPVLVEDPDPDPFADDDNAIQVQEEPTELQVAETDLATLGKSNNQLAADLEKEKELNFELQERIAIMEESASPKAYATYGRINGQVAQIRSLIASVNEWMCKHREVQYDFKRSKGALKKQDKRIAQLEAELAAARRTVE